MAIRFENKRPVYEFADREYDCQYYIVKGTGLEWDFVHEKLGKIDRIKLFRVLNPDISLIDAKNVADLHCSFVKLPLL